jgi:hypothetical protein
MMDGAFSECVRVPERAVIALGQEVSYEAATFADPLTAALNSIERCRIPLGGDAVIVGAGPLGMMHLQLAKLRAPGSSSPTPSPSAGRWRSSSARTRSWTPRKRIPSRLCAS